MLWCGEGRGRMNTIRTIKCSHWVSAVSSLRSRRRRTEVTLAPALTSQPMSPHTPTITEHKTGITVSCTNIQNIVRGSLKKQPKSLQSSKSRHGGWWACWSIGSKAKEYHSEVWFWKDRQKIKQKSKQFTLKFKVKYDPKNQRSKQQKQILLIDFIMNASLPK